MRTSPRAVARIIVAGLVAVFCMSCAVAYGAPTTPLIQAKRAEAARVRATLDDMAARLEAQVEEYDAIDEALQQTRRRIAVIRGDLARESAELARAQDVLSHRVNGIYKTGSVGFLDVILGTDSFRDFLSRLDLLIRVGRHDATLVSAVRDAKQRLEESQLALEAREAEQVALRARAEAQKRRIESAIAERQGYLTALDAEVQRLVVEEKRRQEELARERARRAEEAARRRRAQAASRGDERAVTVPTYDASMETRFQQSSTELSPGHPEVVEVALSYVGVPYVWGGSTPTGFDCSGFVQYCYRKIGVELPRTSRSQAKVGAPVSPDRLDLLEPGDLVFFGLGGAAGAIHHVGIYVGNGDFIHAPQTGESVQVSSLGERIASRGDYVGACRP